MDGVTFAALGTPNYRLYFSGQAISLVGTWMQTVAQSLLVFRLTDSGTAVGVVVALQTAGSSPIGSTSGG